MSIACAQFGVATVACDTSARQRFLATLHERHRRDAAETEIGSLAVNDTAPNPASGTRGIDDEVQTVAVCVTARCSLCANADGGETVVHAENAVHVEAIERVVDDQ